MKVQADRLKEIAIRILKGLHAAEDEAAVVAEALIKAELRGIDTHGVHQKTGLSGWKLIRAVTHRGITINHCRRGVTSHIKLHKNITVI